MEKCFAPTYGDLWGFAKNYYLGNTPTNYCPNSL